MTLGLTEDACPVPLETVGSLYRAERDAFPDLVETIPEATRARLAIYLYSHSHTRELGLRVAATCAVIALKYAAGPLGEAIYMLARQRYGQPEYGALRLVG